MEDLRNQIKNLIVTELQLEDISPDDINSSLPIFGTDSEGRGLGLDSIDALELSIAIKRTFGVAIQPDDESHEQVFASVDTLAHFIDTQRARTA